MKTFFLPVDPQTWWLVLSSDTAVVAMKVVIVIVSSRKMSAFLVGGRTGAGVTVLRYSGDVRPISQQHVSFLSLCLSSCRRLGRT